MEINIIKQWLKEHWFTNRHEAEEAARIANDYFGIGKYKLNFRWFGRSDIEQLNKERGSKIVTAEMFEKMLKNLIN